VAVGSELPQLAGYPFEVRYGDGALVRARAAADVAADAYVYFGRLFSAVEPDIAVIVADEADWSGNGPYGLPFFNDDAGEIRPGIVVMPAGGGGFWIAMAQDLRDASPREYAKLLATYPDGTGGLDLQPFFDLITIAEGYSTLEELQAHYAGSDDSMSPLNYVWFQYRWQRLAATMFEADGEDGLVRFWECFHSADRVNASKSTAASLAPLLTTEVSPTLGQAVRDWR
jgi:hypothetical protein